MAVKSAWPARSRGAFNQYFASLSACLSILNSAACYGWLTPILNNLLGPNSEIPMTAEEAPWVISIIELGNVISPLPAGLLVNRIGRKPVILATGPIYILSWLIILYFPTALVLSLARVVQGFAMGLTFTAAPVYIGEIASNEARGAITSMFFNSWWLGFLIEYAVGPFLSYTNFTYFTLALNIPFILFFSIQPESPYFYLMAGDEEGARSSLQHFRDASPEKVDEELQDIKIGIAGNVKSTKIMDVVATAEDKRALNLLMVLTSVRLLSGTGAIVVYITDVFDRTPNLGIPSDYISIIFGLVLLIGGCCSSVTSDKLGRRPLLLISCIGCLISQLIIGTYYLLLLESPLDVSRISWIAPISIFLFSFLCSAGMYPVCSAYTSELFSSNTRGIASSFSSMAVTVCAFLAMLTYQPITYYFGLYTNFYIYAICSLFGSIYFYLRAPETKGKSFNQIRDEL